jgi:hypothetical protein
MSISDFARVASHKKYCTSQLRIKAEGVVDMREGTSDGSARVQDTLSCPSYFPGYGRERESLLKFELIVM